MDVAQISKADGLAWAARFGKAASPSAFNNTIGTFKLVLDIAVEAGARYDNPAVHIKRKKNPAEAIAASESKAVSLN